MRRSLELIPVHVSDQLPFLKTNMSYLICLVASKSNNFASMNITYLKQIFPTLEEGLYEEIIKHGTIKQVKAGEALPYSFP